MDDELKDTVNRIVGNLQIAQSTGLSCCIICGELITNWNPDPPRYATHDYCEVAISARNTHDPA
jgi:hypothetical protein